MTIEIFIFIFKNMGVAANGSHPISDIAPRAPLLKFLEVPPAPCINVVEIM